MGIHIVVFVEKPPTLKQSNIVKAIQARFPVMVDAIHQSDLVFLKKNYTNARFFFLSEFVSMCPPEELQFIAPDFVISFNDDFVVTEKQWVCISRYIEHLILPDVQQADHILTEATSLLQQFVSPAPLALPPQIQPNDTKENYDLSTHYVSDRDVMLVQVEKPFCDLPYTVVIRNFNEKGYKSFFTDLFICDSWGVSRQDYAFLQQVWNHWNMQGKYDLDSMLQEATQRCYPHEGVQPEAEPEVYRRPIENVLETFQKREQGEQRKEQDLWNQMRLQKRKMEEDLLIN